MSKRPENVYRVKRDRTISSRLVTPEMTVAFRVHYHHPSDPTNYHRVSPLLYESEAATMAENLVTAGFKLLDIPEYRPGGIERVGGWDNVHESLTALEPFTWYRRKALEFGVLFRAEDDVMKKLAIAAAFKARVLDKLSPECSVVPELKELFGHGEKAE